jgi:hypothetical protein
VIGIQYGETDTLVGQRARLYISGISDWIITFSRLAAPRPPSTGPQPPPGDGEWQ